MPAKSKMTFEKANEKLNDVISKMENKDITLEESLKLYEEACGLLSFCYTELDQAKGKIEDINTRIDSIKHGGASN